MKNFILRKAKTGLLFLFFGLIGQSGWGQTTVTIGGGASVACPATPTATYTTPPTGVTFSNWSRGSGVTCGTASTALSGSGFNTASASASYTVNKYFSVTITANATTTFTLSQIVWNTVISTGGGNFTVQYINNGGTLTTFGTAAQTGATTNTFTGTVNVAAGTSIVLYLIPSGIGASGTTVRWVNGSTITVTASNVSPTLTAATLSSAISNTYGTASTSVSFTATGTNLTAANITATAQTGFAVSTDNSTFSSSVSVASGTLVYVRAPATKVAGTFNGATAVVLTGGGAASSVNITTSASGNVVSAKALTVTASAQTKTAGASSPTTGTLDTHFSVSGLVNSDTANQVTLLYSGSPAGNLGTATVGDYTITPSALTFASGSSSNYSITYNTGTLTINAATSPTLTAVTLGSALSSTYGTASTGVSFTASGSNLTGNITATAQSGYEVSISLGSGYGASVSVASGTTVYVRFASTISAGNKNNATAVVLSGGGASSDANVTTSSSGNTVSQKALTVTGLTAQNKVYDGLTTATATGTAVLSGVVGGDAVSLTGSPSFTFVNATVGNSKTVNTTNYSLTGAQASNYSLTQPTLSANITVRSLTITANNVSKVQGVLLSGGAGSTAFTSSGLQNSETIGSVTIAYGTAGATTGDGNTVGVYSSQVTPSAATGGTFTASNYSISYVVGSITVTQAPCGTEDFENMPASNSSSLSRTWTGTNGLTWTAEGARTDRTLNGRAISFGNSGNRWATSPTYSGGMATLRFKYVRDFTGTGARSIQVFVNGVQYGSDITVSNSSDVVVQYESEINLIGNVILEIKSNGASQVKIDDITWTCYSAPEINVKQSSSNLVSGSGSYSFGNVTLGSSTSATIFTIENTGTATLNLTGEPKVAISGHTSDFTINQTSTSATVSASGSTTFTVTFSPSTTGARSATISIANDDSNENPYTFTVTGTGATFAPSVTTSAATSISTTGATLNGEVTSDGGSTITERGFVYKTSSSVTISDNKTVVAGTTGAFSLSPTSLSVNTQYYFRAYAINSVNTSLGSELNFWTLANTPNAPVLSTSNCSSISLSIASGDGNPASTLYAIQENGGQYVQANGSLGESAFWQNTATWGVVTVSSLSPATTCSFKVKARNGATIETNFGSNASLTLSALPSAPTASAQSFCSATSPTVASLVATGTAVQWYSASTGGSSLSSSMALSTQSYYASQTVSGCESTRTSVIATINTNPSAPTASAQSFCSATSPTVASLVATGIAIKWYDASSNGNLVASGTALSAGTYYASQTVAGCESTIRTAATVSLINSGTWTGGSSSWSSAANWCGGIPTASTNVVISNGSPILDVNHTIASGSSLTLSGTATLTINPNAILTIAGTADFGGKSVILKSTSSGTAAIGQVTGSLSGATNVTVERYIPAKRAWRALTAPLKGSNTSLYASWQNAGATPVSPFNTGVELWGPSGTGLASGAGYSIRQYTSSGWADVTNTQSANLFTTTANTAYLVFVTGGYGSANIGNGLSAATTLKATGELITGPVSFAVTSARHTLVGNPFASPISPSAILAGNTQANLYTNIWMWDPAVSTNGTFVNYDASINSGTFSDNSGSYTTSSTAIQSGQAFFVRAVANTDTLTLTEQMKSSSISNTFRNSNNITASVVRVGFAKQIGTEWMPLDGAIAALYNNANAAVDVADGTKMVNTSENVAFVRGTTNLSIEHYPIVNATDQLNVKIWNTQQAHYKLKLNTEEYTMVGVEAWLQDLYTGTSQPLNLDGSMQEYEFDVDPTVSASSGNRFRIVFTNTALAVDTPTQGQLSIYPNPATGGKVTVSLPTGNFEGCSYELINVLGQVVRQDEINNSTSSQVSIPITGLPNSWYALRILKDTSVMFQGKLIIKN